jgi:hypothetical protein
VPRYRYNRQTFPPAPFVHVSVFCPATGTIAESLPAQVDTAADCTIIPPDLADRLALVAADHIPVGGLGGQVADAPLYLVEIRVHDLPPVRVEVLAVANEPHVLLGRDVLNRFRVTLDGPNMLMDID